MTRTRETLELSIASEPVTARGRLQRSGSRVRGRAAVSLDAWPGGHGLPARGRWALPSPSVIGRQSMLRPPQQLPLRSVARSAGGPFRPSLRPIREGTCPVSFLSGRSSSSFPPPSTAVCGQRLPCQIVRGNDKAATRFRIWNIDHSKITSCSCLADGDARSLFASPILPRPSQYLPHFVLGDAVPGDVRQASLVCAPSASTSRRASRFAPSDRRHGKGRVVPSSPDVAQAGRRRRI